MNKGAIDKFVKRTPIPSTSAGGFERQNENPPEKKGSESKSDDFPANDETK